MSRATFYPTAGGSFPRGAPPFRPDGYWATVKWASALVGAETRRALAAEAEIARSVPVLDDSVTEGSANGVKSSGVWAFAKGLLPAWLVPGYAEPASSESVASAVQSVSDALGGHAADAVAHVTEGDRAGWDDKYTKREVDDKLVGLTGEDIPVSSTGSAKVADAISEKRGLTDFDVDGGFGDWQISGGGADYYRIVYDPALGRYEWQIKYGPAEGTVDHVEASELDDKTRLEFSGMVATRSAVSAKLARTANLTSGGLAKFGADGVLEKATEGVDYIKSHQDISGKQDKILETGVLKGGGDGAILPAIPSSSAGETADYRDPLDNTCHKTEVTEWVFSDGVVRTLYHNQNPQSHLWYWNNFSQTWDGTDAQPDGSLVAITESESATFLEFNGGSAGITATRSVFATKDEPFVTADNAARSLECGEGDAKQTMTVENGVVKLDDFFTESNGLLNGRLAYSRNATGLKDRAFNTLSFDGTEFNLSTALEEVTPTASGQPRDLLIVATATAATTIGYTAGTIKGDKPTIDGAGTWLITLTEYASGVWYCRQIKMEDAA